MIRGRPALLHPSKPDFPQAGAAASRGLDSLLTDAGKHQSRAAMGDQLARDSAAAELVRPIRPASALTPCRHQQEPSALQIRRRRAGATGGAIGACVGPAGIGLNEG